MSNRPVLVIQMQRMGDLVLSFPLLGWLRVHYPHNPIWVVAEPVFFKGLMSLAPEVTFFPPDAAPALSHEPYAAIINLSHRPEAAQLAGAASSESLYGPYSSNGIMRVRGNWQLYRASLVHNNRHNLFHWADLNALDCISHKILQQTLWPPIRFHADSKARVGLFLGASEKDKHPTAKFWANLAEALLARGLKPVLLGGKQEMPLGHETAMLLKAPALNMTGRFTLPEFVELTRSLRLLVTPDTGPMHIAAWAGVPTLNLSMGPVSARETAPFPPGHFVLQSTLSCVGCWRCKHPTPLCHRGFIPARIASLVRTILTKPQEALGRMHLPGQMLLHSGRDVRGLFSLNPMDTTSAVHGVYADKQTLNAFWQAYFMHFLGKTESHVVKKCWADFANAAPQIRRKFIPAALRLGRALRRGIQAGQGPLAPDFYRTHPPFIRPLSGYLQQALDNGDCSHAAYADALRMVEFLVECTGSGQ